MCITLKEMPRTWRLEKTVYSFSLNERKQCADSKLKTAFVIMLPVIKKLKIN